MLRFRLNKNKKAGFVDLKNNSMNSLGKILMGSLNVELNVKLPVVSTDCYPFTFQLK